ncbi:MAG: V-type ATP synthase subunit E family protein [Acidobacteriota bacterium]
MSLEKIIENILKDARNKAQEIIKEGEEKAEAVREEARKKAEEQARLFMEESEKRAELEAGRIVTQTKLEAKLLILSTKRQLVDQILAKAFNKEKSSIKGLKKTVILKDGRKEQAMPWEALKEVLRPELESFILEVLEL